MHINPIYRKELKLGTRSLKLPMIFMIYTLLLTFGADFACRILFDGYSSSESIYANVINLFIWVAIGEFVLVLLEIPAFTAVSIAGERERQTLDILLTTNLRPIQIILGKLMSSLSTLFLLTLLSLPVLSITFSIGGIYFEDMIRLFFLILITMFFIGSLGIFFSTILKRTSSATVLSYAALLFILAGTIAIMLIAVYVTSVREQAVYLQTGTWPAERQFHFLPLILLINPGVTMFTMIAKNYFSQSVINDYFEFIRFQQHTFLTEHWFWISILVQILFGVLFLFLAARRLDPLNHKEPVRKKKAKRRKR